MVLITRKMYKNHCMAVRKFYSVITYPLEAQKNQMMAIHVSINDSEPARKEPKKFIAAVI